MIPSLALELIIKFEGFRSKPYLCQANIPTIGYGTTRYESGVPVTLNDAPISVEYATLLLNNYVAKDAAKIVSILPTLPNNEARFSAVISWVYNLDFPRFKSSTFRKKIQANELEAAAFECKKWVFAGGKKSRGLIARRAVEANLILLG